MGRNPSPIPTRALQAPPQPAPMPLPLPPRYHYQQHHHHQQQQLRHHHHHHLSLPPSLHKPKLRRSGYEPSDTETEWQHDASSHEGPPIAAMVPPASSRPKTPPATRRSASASRHGSRNVSPVPPRRHTRSPYKRPTTAQDPTGDDEIVPEVDNNAERWRRVSDPSYRPNTDAARRTASRRITPPEPNNRDSGSILDVPLNPEASVGSNHSIFRSISAPRSRELRPGSSGQGERGAVVAKMQRDDDPNSIHDAKPPSTNAPAMGSSNAHCPRTGVAAPRYNHATATRTSASNGLRAASVSLHRSKSIDQQKKHRAKPSATSSRSGSAASSHDDVGSGRRSSKASDVGSFGKFTANRHKSQAADAAAALLSCVKVGYNCRRSKSPHSRAMIDEALYISRASVVEYLPRFWVDKYSPRSLDGFVCHRKQAEALKQLISSSNNKGLPHILFKGPAGAGKRSLSMALLHDLFGDSVQKVSYDLRRFPIQEGSPAEVAIPVASSPHHVELNLASTSKNLRYALIGIVKEISGGRMVVPEVSEASFKADYKVLILYNIDKVAKNIQHIIKWVMEGYTDICKIVLCCEDDTHLPQAIKNCCKLIVLDEPASHEIMEVLTYIAGEENFELPMSFAAKLATKSNHNMRKAIMALEVCKEHNYPFVDDQPIPFEWEEIILDLSAEILKDPSHDRIFHFRGRLQKLLLEFVPPKIILQKLTEEILKGAEASLKRELYYWHGYYEKRLPNGTTALLKLEEFLAKFMSIHRKALMANQTLRKS